MSKDLPAIKLDSSGKLVLPDDVQRSIVETHINLLRSLKDVDDAMIARAIAGDDKAQDRFYKRVGLTGKGAVDRPELPDVPIHELLRELERRSQLVDATPAEESSNESA